MKTLITGINGFVGTYLAEALLESGHSVSGTVQPGTSTECLGRIAGRLKLIDTDLTDPASINDAVRKSRPQRVFHLAAQSHVPTSWKDPMGTYRVNVEGTLNLIEACAGLRNRPSLLFISSGDVYGSSAESVKVLRETAPLAPMNPYAASKAGAEMMAACLSISRGVPVKIVRPFNHIGPGQNLGFVTSDFASQVAKIEAGIQKPVMKVGDLSAHKDFTDVRDMVGAYMVAIRKCPSGEAFNICAGKTHSIEEMLSILIDEAGINPRIVQDKKRLRMTQSPHFRADCSKFKKLTGWKPTITFRRTLRDILDYWREKVKA